ncbi:MAG TPA: aspartate aminotransferase family protein [Candidatus Limiplasma sp.]|nr:aspartate aminotransferase family protein [Candidatus Limiplasma sp.]HPS81320.1 aspartate aminotransferase family protein [Candidatus Limiplasma sp.]
MNQTTDLYTQYIADSYARFDVTFVRGEGSALFDETGKKYIDMGSGIAVSVLGYGNEPWEKAVCEQAHQLSHVSNLYYTTPQAELAQLLCERSGMKRAFFGNSGAEANECAIKVARKYSADRHGENVRPVVVTLVNSFHGRTLATLAATGQDTFHHTFGPFPEGFAYVEPNDTAALKAVLDGQPVCAVLLETVQGEGGVEPLTREYLQAVRDMTAERDVLMMVDEVQTGNGRTGTLFSYQRYNWLPDVVTTAKGLAGGLPMGVCLMGEKARDTLTPGSHGSTFGGNPICAAAALAVQKQLTDELLADVKRKGKYIAAELTELENVQGVSGRGLMLGVQSDKNPKELVNALLKRGVVCLTAKNKLRLLPPLTIAWDELEAAVEIIKEELAK